MKPISDKKKADHRPSTLKGKPRTGQRLCAALFLSLIPAFAAAAGGPSARVPESDPTYGELSQLETAGLLPPGAAHPALTRLEVAQRIFQARENLREIVLAQADDEIPPPPADDSAAAASPAESAPPAPSEQPASAPPAAQTESTAAAPAAPSTQEAPKAETLEDLAKAEENLHSLEEAYQYELKKVQGEVKAVGDSQSSLESGQYDLWKRIMGVTEYPTISWHGLGRAFGLSQQYYGVPITGLRPSERAATGYLDFEPVGVVDKQIRWDAIIRYQTAFESDANVGIDSIYVRRATMEFNPPWFSATLGDFDQSYTPLTLWNRDNLDLRYSPEMLQRQDDFQKYESYFNHEPDWPFRGLRIGTEVQWPDSDILDRFKIGVMANMIRSGFNDNGSGGTYFGPTDFTDWIFGANAEVKSKRWYLNGFSLQLGLDAYGIEMDEPLYSNQPYSPYAPFNPATWAHSYKITSLKPSFDVGMGGDSSFGGVWEGAFSTYQDDVRDPSKTVSDYAILAGPYVRFGASKVSLNYLNVGPNYFSPLAQTRQDDLQPGSATLYNGAAGPDLFSAPLRSQFFLSDVPRASGIFSFYDRTQDNTFPYGLATPNRQGFGLELDVKTLEKDALKILGSAYFVSEISDNFVVNVPATGFVPVDALTGAPAPKRNFTYVNVGPSFNLGPYLHTGDLEVGTNVRYEQTSSDIGTLTSTWILGGVKAEIFSWWDAAASFGAQQFNGSEAGYGGSTLARYSYEFDNSDLGQYQLFTVNGSRQSWRLSTAFKASRNSTVYLDYDLTWGNELPYAGSAAGGTLNNQFMELTYEIQF